MTSINLSEYDEPANYDLENGDFEPDGPFYLTLAQRIGGRALELGCGTGRITIPLAEAGVNITGLDLVPGMLDRARAKAAHVSVRWVQADARSFTLDEKFDLIFESGSTFQHLLERPDQEAMLKCVRQQLSPGGWFVVSTIFPALDLLESDPEEHDWFTYSDNSGREIRVSGTQAYDALRQIKTETAVRRWRADDGQDMTRYAPLSLRYWFPQELDALLHYNGFSISERYGDHDFSPLTADSPHIIYLCQPAP